MYEMYENPQKYYCLRDKTLLTNRKMFLLRVLGVFERCLDRLDALPPLELGKPHVVQEQMLMVLVQVESRLEKTLIRIIKLIKL